MWTKGGTLFSGEILYLFQPGALGASMAWDEFSWSVFGGLPFWGYYKIEPHLYMRHRVWILRDYFLYHLEPGQKLISFLLPVGEFLLIHIVPSAIFMSALVGSSSPSHIAQGFAVIWVTPSVWPLTCLHKTAIEMVNAHWVVFQWIFVGQSFLYSFHRYLVPAVL